MKSLNILRALSIVLICIAHICLQLGFGGLGRYLGYMFVDVFFLLSAFLQGLKYGGQPVGLPFLKKRYLRLSVIYYPFLLITIVALFCLGYHVEFKSILLHLTYANYLVNNHLFGTAFGHLWYLSMQMVCYVMIVLLCGKYLYAFSKKIVSKKASLYALTLLAFVGGYILVHLGLPNRVCVVLLLYYVVYLKADFILKRFMQVSTKVCWIFFLVFNFLTFLLFLYWDLDGKLIIRDWLVVITSFSWLMMFLRPIKVIFPKVLNFLSMVSFELYLIHHPFVLGELSWIHRDDSRPWMTVIEIVLTMSVVVCLSWLLHHIGKLISGMIVKK